MLERECSVEFLELSSAISEGCESLSEDPGGEPAFCGVKTLESLDGLESAVELFVHTLNQVGGSRTIDVEDGLCFDVGGELLAAFEDVVHRGDLHGIVLMTRRAPADPGFQPFSAEEGNTEDVLFEVSEETPVGFLAADLEGSANVLQEVHMADLHDATGEDVLRRLACRFILITGHAS